MDRQYYIFDADTHMSPYENFEGSIHGEEWEAKMCAAGVDRALAWLLPQEVQDVSESNAYIYENAKKNPRVLPFGWANIKEGLEKAKQDARTCLLEYGFQGVKLNGAQNEYYIDSPEALEVIGVIAKLGGMTAFHIGADYPEFTDPRRAQKAARMFPKMPILMVHMGGAGDPDVSEAVIEIARENPNMYLVGSAIGVDKVRRAIDILGPDRVLFGSDTPFYDVEKVKEEYFQMLASYDEETTAKVMGLNAKRLFGIKTEEGR
ncbi:MAG: amidohydrolase family protein [Lachnospiraceae bacterium]|nr:amidohydrolase family protein [Lachnospiraceae bacterium]